MVNVGRLSSVQVKEALKTQLLYDKYVGKLHEDGLDDKALEKELALLTSKNGQDWAVDDVSGVDLDP